MPVTKVARKLDYKEDDDDEKDDNEEEEEEKAVKKSNTNNSQLGKQRKPGIKLKKVKEICQQI